MLKAFKFLFEIIRLSNFNFLNIHLRIQNIRISYLNSRQLSKKSIQSAQCVELNFLSSAVDKKTLIRIGVSILPFYKFKLLKWNVNEIKSQNGQKVCTRNKANKTSFLSVMGEKEHLDKDVPDNLARLCYKHLITSCFSVTNIAKTKSRKKRIFTR